MSFEIEQFNALVGSQLFLLGITLPSQTELMSNTEHYDPYIFRLCTIKPVFKDIEFIPATVINSKA